MKKWLLIVVIAVLCLGAIFVGWKVYRHNREVATVTATTFQTYLSEGLNFTIEYPETWTVQEGTPGIDPEKYWAVVFNSTEWTIAKDDDKQYPNFAVNYYSDLDVLLAFEARTMEEKSLEKFMKSSMMMTDVRPITLLGNPAWRALLQGDDGIDTIFTENNGHIYALGISNRVGLSDPMADKLIASFKFLK